jgi:putative nucleotidyltransferase with HDIG domain
MIDPSVSREQRIKRIQNYVFRMPNLSTTVTKVLEICNNPKTSPNDLNRVISLDPVLTGKVLTLINSAYYSLPKRVTSLTRAIIMLGLNTVRNLALSTAVLDAFGRRESFPALSIDEFWTHSLCVGVTAKSLAMIKDVPATEREEYFVAGLLHDLGKIPLNSCFPDEYLQALKSAELEQEALYRTETAVIGFDHCRVGTMIAEKWHLSETMNDALCHHHNLDDVKEENRGLMAIVALANAYANTLEKNVSGADLLEDSVGQYLLEQVGISWHVLADLSETVLSEIEKARVFLQLTEKG